MDWIAKCFTGQDTELFQKFEDSINENKIDDSNPDELSLEEKIEREEELISGLVGLGFPINYK